MPGILERISRARPDLEPDPIGSVLENLRAILNTNEGDGYTAPSLGVDFIELLARWPSSENDVVRAMHRTIEQYEPRLTRVDIRRVDPEEGAVSIEFEISGELLSRGRIRLATKLHSRGRVGVSRR